jgi:acetyl-CoA carboxylase biotin carboxyl carrier protein
MTTNSGPGNQPDRELIQSVWEEARDLVKRLEGTTVQKFKVEAGEYKIEIERGAPAMVAAAPAAPAAAPAPAAPFDSELDGASAAPDLGHPILAPLVGTFYRAPQPGAPPFVEEGDVVDEGQTVGIVEAMKLMNEVKADRGGKITQFAATDGDWVEFEQPLVYLEPAEE